MSLGPRVPWFVGISLALALGCGDDGDDGGDAGSDSAGDLMASETGTEGTSTISTTQVSAGEETGPITDTEGIPCEYTAPDPSGCPEGTVDCEVGGPAVQCVPPEQVEMCCCPDGQCG